MINQQLLFARAYEKEGCAEIPSEARPTDPNGFSFYQIQNSLQNG
jgi:hypothetical protein